MEWLAVASFRAIFGIITGFQVWISMITHEHSVPRLIGFHIAIWEAWLAATALTVPHSNETEANAADNAATETVVAALRAPIPTLSALSLALLAGVLARFGARALRRKVVHHAEPALATPRSSTSPARQRSPAARPYCSFVSRFGSRFGSRSCVVRASEP
jgi:hypothetical protein